MCAGHQLVCGLPNIRNVLQLLRPMMFWVVGGSQTGLLHHIYNFSHMKDKKYSVAYVTNKFIHLGLTSGEREGGVRDLVYCI